MCTPVGNEETAAHDGRDGPLRFGAKGVGSRDRDTHALSASRFPRFKMVPVLPEGRRREEGFAGGCTVGRPAARLHGRAGLAEHNHGRNIGLREMRITLPVVTPRDYVAQTGTVPPATRQASSLASRPFLCTRDSPPCHHTTSSNPVRVGPASPLPALIKARTIPRLVAHKPGHPGR